VAVLDSSKKEALGFRKGRAGGEVFLIKKDLFAWLLQQVPGEGNEDSWGEKANFREGDGTC